VTYTPQSSSIVKVSNHNQNGRGAQRTLYSNADAPADTSSTVYTFERWQQIQQQNKDKFESRQDILNPINYNSYNEYLRSMTKHFNLDNPAPFISARSWAMYNIDTCELMFAKQEKITRQVASLTKVMTAHVVVDLMSKLGLDWTKVMVNVLTSSTTPMLGGTSAQLLPGEKLCVKELMFAMMLPSGNDAAQSLAIYFGHLSLIHASKSSGAGASTKTRSAMGVDANIYESDYPEEEEPASEQEQE